MTRPADPSPAIAVEAEAARFGLFGMGVLQRIALSGALAALVAAAAWWALA